MAETAQSARRRRPALGAAEHSLLGLLAGADGMHGYDLARIYTDGPLGEIIRLEPGMLYHHLKKLERFDLVASQIERQTDRPDRRIHTITDAGSRQLEAWLAEPVRATREIRLDFLLKLFFARRLAPDRLPRLVREQREVLDLLATSLATQIAALPDDADGRERRSVLALRHAQTRTAIEWLDALAVDHAGDAS